MRQAMSMAVDREMIIDYVHNGEASVSTFVAPNLGHWVWDAVNESPLYTYDVEAARALMEEAGYGEDNRLSLTMAAGLLDTIRDTAVVLQQQLKEIYIDVEITNLESGEYVDIWGIMDTPEAGFDMMCGQNGSGTDPNRAVSFFFSTTGGANVWGYLQRARGRALPACREHHGRGRARSLLHGGPADHHRREPEPLLRQPHGVPLRQQRAARL